MALDPAPGGRSARSAAAAARRQSMPYFQNANWSAEVSCLPTCLEPGERPRYEPVLAGPHLMGKFRRSVSLGMRPGNEHWLAGRRRLAGRPHGGGDDRVVG